MGIRIHLGLLLWKNFIYRRRQKFQLILEVLWPLFLLFILVCVQKWGTPIEQHECHFINKALPSAGTVHWLSGIFCPGKPCYHYPTPGETPGVVENYNDSIFSQLLSGTQNLIDLLNNTEFLKNLTALSTSLLHFSKRSTPKSAMKVKAYLKKNETFSQFIQTSTSFPPELVDELLGSHLQLQVFSHTRIPLKQIVCNASILSEYLTAKDAHLFEHLQKVLCSLPEATLQVLEHSFISNVNWTKFFGKRLTSRSVHVMKAVESLSSFLQHTESLAKEVSSKASFVKFQEAPQVLSGWDSNFSPRGYFEQLVLRICGRMIGEHTNISDPSIHKQYENHEYHDAWRVNMTSFQCKSMYTGFSHSYLHMGKILYTPPTLATQRVMAEVNQTFQNLAKLYGSLWAWREMGKQINTMIKGPIMRAIQNLLSIPGVARVLEQRLHGSFWNISTLQNFLLAKPEEQIYTWHKLNRRFYWDLRHIKNLIECVSLNRIEAVSSEEELVSHSMALLEQDEFWAGIVFLLSDDQSKSHANLPPHVQFKIRMNIDDSPPIHKIKDRYWNPGTEYNKTIQYVQGGFVYIQDLVEQAIMRVHMGTLTPQRRTGIYIQQIPYPCYVDDVDRRQMIRLLPLFIILGWIYSVAMIIKSIVHEKETYLKMTMKVMGLSSTTLWLGWFLSSFIAFSISTALQVVILKVGDFLHYSDPVVLFLFLTSFAVATISQCFLISTFFSQANVAIAWGGIIYFSFYLAYVLCTSWPDHITFPLQLFVSLLSPVAFGFGFEFFLLYEGQGVGVQWGNMFSSPTESDHYSIGTSAMLLLFDAFLYGVATWYIEAVFPGQYGIAKPWNFPLRKSYWFGESSKDACIHPIPMNTFHPPEVIMEDPPAHLNVGISIRNLVKIYHGSSKVAIHDLSLDIYEGQITSFLGHNGAGKTTMMSVLMGLLPPTSGTAYIMGRDICSEMDTIRKVLGICPQYNVLFEMLTVEEHIWFYGRLKGLSEQQVKDEMEQIIQDVGLLDKRWAPTKKLSGGMFRKLSVAIAFIGGSKVVILDEPTVGIDPCSRQGIWELLVKYKAAGRTIILSTHDMEEADFLSDRVAIISQGQLCCCGSSLFLKTKLGTGYHLTLVKWEADRGIIDGINSTNQKADSYNIVLGNKDSSKAKSKDNSKANSMDVSQLTNLIQRLIPGAQLVENIGQKVVYILPYGGSKDGSFGKLFKELDSRLNKLGISEYGISDTSFKEIFLNVAKDTSMESPGSPQSLRTSVPADTHTMGTVGEETRETKDELAAEDGKETDHLHGGGLQASRRLVGCSLIFQQFRALFTKRFLYTTRNLRRFFVQIVFPAFFVFLILLITLIDLPTITLIDLPSKYPPLRLEHGMYGPQLIFFSDDSLPEDHSSSQLLKALLEDPGFGTKCMRKEGDLKDPCPFPSLHETSFKVPEVRTSVGEVFQNGNWTLRNPSPECKCSSVASWKIFPDCPEAAGGLPPPQMHTKSGDTLYNLTGRNISDYLVKTYPKTFRKQYGGFSLGAHTSQLLPSTVEVEAMVKDIYSQFAGFKSTWIKTLLDNLPSVVDGLNTHQNMKVWFNNKGWHAMVSYVNIANNGLLRANLPSGADRSRYGITVINHPLNLSKYQQIEVDMKIITIHLWISIFVMFAMSFIPASYVLFLIEERVSKSKHLQIISGMKPVVYWVGNFAWDMCNYLVSVVLVVLIFMCFQEKAYMSSANLQTLILLFLFYGWSSIPMMYPASFFFNAPRTAYIALTYVNLFIGINAFIATLVVGHFSDPLLDSIYIFLKNAFLIIPHFCLGHGLMNMMDNQAADVYVKYGDTGNLFKPQPSRDMVGNYLLAMAIDGVIFFSFTLLMQYKFFIQLRYENLFILFSRLFLAQLGEEDEDVAKERQRINNRISEDILVLQDLSKVYWMNMKAAVDRLSFGVPAGECFGLLGMNGAGKTSTFQMLTGDLEVTSGNAFLAGYSILTNMKEVHKNIGYCPQVDAINNLLTGREHMVFYCRLHGIPEDEIPGVVKVGLSTLELMQYADRPAGQYSRGNKRKLSTAISLIGAPPVILLDEPTTGVDQETKQLLWNCILRMIKDGRSVVFTSHSMEECEALCTRMAIMVNGHFQYLGTVQHLKNKFGEGYTIILRVSGTIPDTGAVEKFMQDSFPGIILKQKYHYTLQYQLLSHSCSLAKIFDILASHWSDYHITDYSISQTTLDQVFIHLAK